MSKTKFSFACLDSDSEDDAPNPAGGAPAPVAAAPPQPPPRAARGVGLAARVAAESAAAAARTRALAALPQYEKPWVLFEEIDDNDKTLHPCQCCSLMTALSEEADRWTCARSGLSWVVLECPFDERAPHSGEHCYSGNCPQHRLHRGDMGRWIRGIAMGRSWMDLLDEEQDALDALKSAEELEAERAAHAAVVTAALRETEVASQAHQIQRVQEAVQNRYAARGKTWEPCKKLYDCQGGGAAGGVARPTKLHVCTECWGWEYTDPRTGQIVRKRTCPWLHPGEEGWQPEWDTDRTSRVAAERVRALKAAQAAAGGGAAAGASAPGEWQRAGGARPAPRGDGRSAAQRRDDAAYYESHPMGGGRAGGGSRPGGGRGGGGGGGRGGDRYGSGSGARGGW